MSETLYGWLAGRIGLRSRGRLEAEILVLQQQINVLQRNSPKGSVFRTFDRLVFVGLYHLAPSIVDALAIVRPETAVRWHRAGFRSFWHWKSSRRGGRPRVPLEFRKLIRDISLANPLWGAPRIHGELLKLGIDIGQTSVAKYMARRRGGPSQGWRTFLCNHADGIRLHGLVRRADAFLPTAVWVPDLAAPPTSNHVAGGDGKPDG